MSEQVSNERLQELVRLYMHSRVGVAAHDVFECLQELQRRRAKDRSPAKEQP